MARGVVRKAEHRHGIHQLAGLGLEGEADLRVGGQGLGVDVALVLERKAPPLERLAQGAYSGGDRETFAPLVRSLVTDDPFFVLADFRAYVEAQRRVARAFASPAEWGAAAVRNVAAMGRFSSDRSIREYAERVWTAPAPAPGRKRR